MCAQQHDPARPPAPACDNDTAPTAARTALLTAVHALPDPAAARPHDLAALTATFDALTTARMLVDDALAALGSAPARRVPTRVDATHLADTAEQLRLVAGDLTSDPRALCAAAHTFRAAVVGYAHTLAHRRPAPTQADDPDMGELRGTRDTAASAAAEPPGSPIDHPK